MNGKNLKKLRTTLNQTQAAFAQEVGYKTDTISKMETGMKRITEKFIQLLQYKYPKQMKKVQHARNPKTNR